MIQVSKKFDESCQKRVIAVSQLKKGAHLHLIGICGTGMASVMTLLNDLGFRVTGSDKSFYPPMGDIVRRTADKVYEGYSKDNLSEKPDFVVIGNALSANNIEVEAAINLGLPFASMPEVFSALLIGDHQHCKNSVVVCGTHGKTTTTAAIASILESSGRKPGFFIGGKPNNFSTSIREANRCLPSEQRIVVLEGDEYDSAFFSKFAKFQHYRADILLKTSLEFDHADIYNSVEEIQEQFVEVAKKLPANGFLIACDEGDKLQSCLNKIQKDTQFKAKILKYGTSSLSDFYLKGRNLWTYQDLPEKRFGQKFNISIGNKDIEFFTLLSGYQNVLNLVGAIAVCYRLGVGLEEIVSGVKNFTGVSRRQEIVADSNGIVLIDDFAHHPTAVKLTLEGIRASFPGKRLVAVFEPRSNTTRKGFFLEDYVEALSVAEIVKVQEVVDSGYSQFSNSQKPLDVKELVAKMKQRFNIYAESFSNTDEIFESLKKDVKSGDVVVCMSNGDFGGLVEKLKTLCV